MFGMNKNKRVAENPRQSALAHHEERISKLPVGRTGASRVEEELLCPTDPENEVESWRIFKIMAELVSGFELLRGYDLAATIFGSARCIPDSNVYAIAENLGGQLAKEGFAVITGGGGGVMDAANKGAKEAGGRSVGLNIELSTKQSPNSNTTDAMQFHYFFTRKVMLSFSSEVYIFFPGGFGTLDEFFEMLTLVQTKKIKPIPIILIGKNFWSPLIAWFEETLKNDYRTIDENDMKLYTIVDTADEAMAEIRRRLTL